MSSVAHKKELQAARGYTDNFYRMSVGIEEPEDLIRDLEEALGKVHALRHALLHPPTPDEFNQYSNANDRSALLRNRAESSQWGMAYLGILGVT